MHREAEIESDAANVMSEVKYLKRREKADTGEGLSTKPREMAVTQSM